MRKGRRSGLTLVEVMISLAVMAFVLLAFMSIMYSASSFSASTREGLLATYDLQSAVEDSLGIPYATFAANYVAGPTFQGKTSDGLYNNTPTPSNHPLEKYWSTSAHPRGLREEQMWIEIISGGGVASSATTYRIVVTWKTSKGSYQRESVVMQRASR